jgi:hypothetical protein
MQYERLTSASMTPAQTLGMGVTAHWEQTPFPASAWSSVLVEPQSSVGSTREYSIPASGALGSNENGAAFLHGSTPFSTHGTLFRIMLTEFPIYVGGWSSRDAATAQYRFLQQARSRRLTGMGSWHRPPDPNPSRLAPGRLSSQGRTGAFREIGPSGSSGNNNQPDS